MIQIPDVNAQQVSVALICCESIAIALITFPVTIRPVSVFVSMCH